MLNNQFEKELLKTIDELFQLTDKDHKEILKLYKKSKDNIQYFIAELFVKYGKNGMLSMAELNKFNRISKVEEQLNEELKQLAKSEAKKMVGILGSIYTLSYYKTAYTIEKNMSISIDFNLLKKEFVDEVLNYNWSGIMFSERVWDNVNGLAKSLKGELYRGIREGESIDKIARRINKQFDSKAYQSQRLIRTEASRVINEAQNKLYKKTDVISKVQYVATLDNRTSDVCSKLDGRIWNKDDDYPVPPLHPNCRSTIIGVIDGYSPTKRKDNETKEIISYQSYDQWYNLRVEKKD